MKPRTLPGFSQDWLAIAWFPHRRFQTITDRLAIPCVVLSSRAIRIVRYLVLTMRMIGVISRERPKVLLVQNPSIGCALVAIAMRTVFRYTVIVDAHNEAVAPYNYDNLLVRLVARWLMRAADCTLVTNSQLADRVLQIGGAPMVLMDPIPVAPTDGVVPADRINSVVVVSTYASDEPLEEMFCAAAELEAEGISILVTGRPNAERLARIGTLPRNVTLAGYLSDADYWGALRSAVVIVDLTKMPNCLVCGAYEAVAVGKPLILTDDPAARSVFGPAATFTKNAPREIAGAIRAAVADRVALEHRTTALRSSLNIIWLKQAREFVDAANCQFIGVRSRRKGASG